MKIKFRQLLCLLVSLSSQMPSVTIQTILSEQTIDSTSKDLQIFKSYKYINLYKLK